MADNVTLYLLIAFLTVWVGTFKNLFYINAAMKATTCVNSLCGLREEIAQPVQTECRYKHKSDIAMYK